jgi:hypothetical protein
MEEGLSRRRLLIAEAAGQVDEAVTAQQAAGAGERDPAAGDSLPGAWALPAGLLQVTGHPVSRRARDDQHPVIAADDIRRSDAYLHRYLYIKFIYLTFAE